MPLKFKTWVNPATNKNRVYINDEIFNRNYVKVFFELHDGNLILFHKITGFEDKCKPFHNLAHIKNFLKMKYPPEDFTIIKNELQK